MNKEKRRAIFERFHAQNPHPTTELLFKNPFELLIAVILSAQATDVSVNKATEMLFKAAPNAQDFLKLQVEGLKPYIQSIGLFNTKASILFKLVKY